MTVNNTIYDFNQYRGPINELKLNPNRIQLKQVDAVEVYRMSNLIFRFILHPADCTQDDIAWDVMLINVPEDAQFNIDAHGCLIKHSRGTQGFYNFDSNAQYNSQAPAVAEPEQKEEEPKLPRRCNINSFNRFCKKHVASDATDSQKITAYLYFIKKEGKALNSLQYVIGSRANTNGHTYLSVTGRVCKTYETLIAERLAKNLLQDSLVESADCARLVENIPCAQAVLSIVHKYGGRALDIYQMWRTRPDVDILRLYTTLCIQLHLPRQSFT